MIYTPDIFPVLVAAVVFIWMAFNAIQFKNVPTARLFSVFVSLLAFWELSQVFYLLTPSLELKFILLELRAATNGFIPPCNWRWRWLTPDAPNGSPVNVFG